ncbi:MAG: hypothetical protein ACTSRS_21325 [Candidatus Helarchaeota archaeon]
MELVPPFSVYLGIDGLHLNLNGKKIYVLGYSDAKNHSLLDFDPVYSKETKSYSESITRFLAKHPIKPR